MRLTIAIVCACGSLARAGVDDDVDVAPAWCDGAMIAYDEGAIVASGERIDVRRASIGCRGGAGYAFAIGRWGGDARIDAGATQPSHRAELARTADAVTRAHACGAGLDPTDVVIAANGARVRCAAWLDPDVKALARAISSAIVTPDIARKVSEARERFSDVDDVTLRF